MEKMSFWPIWDEIQKVRKNEGFEKAIQLANSYIAKDPTNVEPYLQLVDMYYLMGELEKAEKPIDFILAKDIHHPGVDKAVFYYLKALLLAERTEWDKAIDYIKQALKLWWDNPEYRRVLAMVEYRRWNKNKWYQLIKELIEDKLIDADVILDAVTMALWLWYVDDVKEFINLYFENQDKISFFSKPKSYYDKKFQALKNAFLSSESNEWIK